MIHCTICGKVVDTLSTRSVNFHRLCRTRLRDFGSKLTSSTKQRGIASCSICGSVGRIIRIRDNVQDFECLGSC